MGEKMLVIMEIVTNEEVYLRNNCLNYKFQEEIGKQ